MQVKLFLALMGSLSGAAVVAFAVSCVRDWRVAMTAIAKEDAELLERILQPDPAATDHG